MGLDLPGPLATLLNDLGYIWPEVDEVKLLQLGRTWAGFSPTLSGHASQSTAHASKVWTQNEGEAITAFETAWNSRRAPAVNIGNASSSTKIVGVALMGASAIVLGLKINVIGQLAALAAEIIEAIATAFETFGASLLEIPVFKEITGRIIGAIMNEAISALMQA
jgi:hypothetical protein